jgi:hypothetical protein
VRTAPSSPGLPRRGAGETGAARNLLHHGMRPPVLTVAFALLAAGCSSLTTIESSWKDPTYSREPFERVAVVALFDSTAESRQFEENAAQALEARGIEAVRGYTLLDDRMYEQEELRAKLSESNVDGILIYRLIAVDEQDIYRAPTPYLNVPPGVLGDDPYYWYYYPSSQYYWYWRSSLDVTSADGYWEELSFVVVESSLYDAERDQLVWTAKSSTIDDARFEAVSSSIAKKVTRALEHLGALGSRANG